MGAVALDAGEPKWHAHVVDGRLDGTTLDGRLVESCVHPSLTTVLVSE